MSNLSFGSGVIVVFLFTGSPDRVSALSGPATRAGIRPVIRGHRPEGPDIRSRFPAAFRPPAFASRSSDSRRGVGSSSRSTYRPSGRTSTGLPRSARMSSDRGGCPLYPGDDGAHPGREPCPAGVCRISAATSLAPRFQHSIRRGSTSRGINEGSRNSPVRSSPRPPPLGWDEQPLRLSPELRTLPTGARQRTSGWGQAI